MQIRPRSNLFAFPQPNVLWCPKAFDCGQRLLPWSIKRLNRRTDIHTDVRMYRCLRYIPHVDYHRRGMSVSPNRPIDPMVLSILAVSGWVFCKAYYHTNATFKLLKHNLLMLMQFKLMICTKYFVRSHLPRILLILELCISGHALRIFLLSSRAHTINAFIGLFTWGCCASASFGLFDRIILAPNILPETTE